MFPFFKNKEADDKVIELEKQAVVKASAEKIITIDDIKAKDKIQWIRFADEEHVGQRFEWFDNKIKFNRAEQTNTFKLPKGLIKLISAHDSNGYYKHIMYINYYVGTELSGGERRAASDLGS